MKTDKERFREWQAQRPQTVTSIPNTFYLEDWLPWQSKAPESSWLLKGLLKPSNVTVLAGQPTVSYKTWTAIAAAIAVARGAKTFGMEPVGEPKTVLFIEAESPGKSFSERFYAMKASMGDDYHFDYLNEKFLISHMPGVTLEDSVDSFVETIVQKDVRLIVLDTYAALTQIKENEAEELKTIALIFEKFRAVNCAVLLVHHTTKASWGNTEHYNANAALRGSGALAGHTDAIWLIREKEGAADGKAKLWELVSNEYESPRYYSASWSISSDEDGNANAASVNFEKLESWSAFSSDDLDLFLEKLMHGEQYGIKALAGAWDLQQKIARKVADTLTKEGTLEYNSEKKKWLYA